MKPEVNNIDYGIYIDRKRSFIVALNHFVHEELLLAETEDNEGLLPRSTNVNRQQVHLQNDKNENLKKFCKHIISRIENAHRILVFGPSMPKFELQQELKETKRLKHIEEILKTTESMTRNEAQLFVQEHYT